MREVLSVEPQIPLFGIALAGNPCVDLGGRKEKCQFNLAAATVGAFPPSIE